MTKQIFKIFVFAVTMLFSHSAMAQEVKPQVIVRGADGQPLPAQVGQTKTKTQEYRREQNLMFIQLQRIDANGSYKLLNGQAEVWSNVAKFVRRNSAYEPVSRGTLQGCLEYDKEALEIVRVQCRPNSSLFFLDISSRVKEKVNVDMQAVQNNQKWSIWQQVIGIGARIGADQLYRHGRWGLGQMADYGGFYGASMLEAKKRPTHSIELIYRVDVDNYGYFDTTGKRIDRRLKNFRLTERFREFRVKVYGDGRAEFVSFVFKGEPTETPDGQPAWRYDDITLPFKGMDLGDDWATKLESLAFMQIINELMGDQFVNSQSSNR